MKRSHDFSEREEEGKRQRRDLSPHIRKEVFAQLEDMSEPEPTPSTYATRPRESIPNQSLPSPVSPEKYYHIRETGKRSSRKFRTTAYTYRVKFKDVKSDKPLEKAEEFITDVWDSLLTTLKQYCQAKEDNR